MNEENRSMQEETPRVPADKRYSLLRYMAIMFAVAFILVGMSLIFQSKGMNRLRVSNNSALAKAVELQSTNQKQAETIRKQETELEELKKQLSETTPEKDAETLRRGYDALLYVLTAESAEGDVEYARALSTVEDLRQALSPSAAEMLDAVLAARE